MVGERPEAEACLAASEYVVHVGWGLWDSGPRFCVKTRTFAILAPLPAAGA